MNTIEAERNIQMHLKFCCMTASYNCHENRHPQIVMRELGITYQCATPQSLGDQWWFWNCENIPDALPKFLGPLNLNPMKCIGFGLSKEKAEAIVAASIGSKV